MKKLITSAAVAAGLCVGAVCATVYSWFGTTPEQAHQYAVEKVTDYAENYVVKKIQKSDNLTEAGKVKLVAETARIKQEILDKIAELKAKYDAAKEAKQAEKAEKAVEKVADKVAEKAAVIKTEKTAEVAPQK